MISVIIATHGLDSWETLARERAAPSAVGQLGVAEVVVLHDSNDGATVSQVRNQGAAIASQPWLLFLDGDDELDPLFGAHMVAAINASVDLEMLRRKLGVTQTTPPLFTPAVQYLRGRSKPTPRIWPEQDLRDGNWLVIGTLVAAELFARVGGFHDWPLYEDWCLWQRCHRAGATIVKVPDAVYVAHVSPMSRNRAPSRSMRLETHDRIRRANYPELYEEEEEAG